MHYTALEYGLGILQEECLEKTLYHSCLPIKEMCWDFQ